MTTTARAHVLLLAHHRGDARLAIVAERLGRAPRFLLFLDRRAVDALEARKEPRL